MIRADEANRLFYLESEESQTVIGLYEGELPVLYHWGRPIAGGDLNRIPARPGGYGIYGDDEGTYSPARLPLEYPCGETGDFRSPSYIARDDKGRPSVDLRFASYVVLPGRPDIGGMPGARISEAETDVRTLVLTLEDAVTGLSIDLRYTPLNGVLLRSARFLNKGARPITLEKAFSFNIDFFPDRELEIVALEGAWARERKPRRFALPAGRWESGSRRGVSSHQAWPGVVLARGDATEETGEVWGAALIWSGDWTMSVERDEDGGRRLQGGLNPEFFRKTLMSGEAFTTPEAVLAYSCEGLSGLSAKYHAFVTKRLLPPFWARRERPILANNWEATYFDFSEEKLLALADGAAACGVEVFVLDDGWFGKRDDDRSSLGDWKAHSGKFPRGLKAFAQDLNARGLGFGLWIEPEMVSPDSELYRAHPDWCLHMDGRRRSLGRNQLALDLTIPEVRKYIVRSITELLSSIPISYVKWDMNRPFSHAGADRYEWTLGLYEILGEITTAFPQVLFEGCAGGGGRMDFGLLYFMGQYWTSDNTDAVERLKIQEGTSLFLPPITMGCHVSAVPNHQTGRITTLGARTRAAFAGNLGYELDFTALGPEEKAAISSDIAWYKARRRLIQTGRFRRTRTSLEDENTVAWQIHAEDGSEALLFWFRPFAEANTRFPLYRWQGLDPEARYETDWHGRKGETEAYSGSELISRGMVIPLTGGDADGAIVRLRALSR